MTSKPLAEDDPFAVDDEDAPEHVDAAEDEDWSWPGSEEEASGKEGEDVQPAKTVDSKLTTPIGAGHSATTMPTAAVAASADAPGKDQGPALVGNPASSGSSVEAPISPEHKGSSADLSCLTLFPSDDNRVAAVKQGAISELEPAVKELHCGATAGAGIPLIRTVEASVPEGKAGEGASTDCIIKTSTATYSFQEPGKEDPPSPRPEELAMKDKVQVFMPVTAQLGTAPFPGLPAPGLGAMRPKETFAASALGPPSAGSGSSVPTAPSGRTSPAAPAQASALQEAAPAEDVSMLPAAIAEAAGHLLLQPATAAHAPCASVEITPVSPKPSKAFKPLQALPAGVADVADSKNGDPSIALGADDDGGEVHKAVEAVPGNAQRASGWGGWGLSVIGNKLRAVAVGAAKDVAELSQSFQQALADVTGTDDEEEEMALHTQAEKAEQAAEQEGDASFSTDPQVTPPGASTGAATAPAQEATPARPADRSRGRGSSSSGKAHATSSAAHVSAESILATAPGELGMQSEDAADKALSASGASSSEAGGGVSPGRRVRGASVGVGGGGSGSGVEDSELDVGLQAIDMQVEEMASGAAKALSSIWGGLAGVAKVVASEVAASIDVRGVAHIGSQLATRAERGLETVGRRALTLLEAAGGAGMRSVWGDGHAGARAAGMGRDPASYEDFFYIYGGEALAEELEALANECSHACNRSRSKLEESQQAALDATLAALVPYFAALPFPPPAKDGLPCQQAVAGAEGLEQQQQQQQQQQQEEEDVLSQAYEPVAYLCQASVVRAVHYQEQLVASLCRAAGAARTRARGASADRTVGTGARQGGGSAAGSQDDESRVRDPDHPHEDGHGSSDDDESEREEGAEDADADGGQHAPSPQQLLASFRTHSGKRMAEMCAAQLQVLLDLGTSLATPARSNRPAADGLLWPSGPAAQAALLQRCAVRMLADLSQAAAAYRAALAAFQDACAALPLPVVELAGDTGPVVAESGEGTGAVPGTVQGGGSMASVDASSTGLGHEGAMGANAAAAGDGKDVDRASEGARVAEAVGGTLATGLSAGHASSPLSTVQASALVMSNEIRRQLSKAHGHVQGGFHGLVYAVLLRCLVMDIANAVDKGQGEVAGEA